MGAFLLSRTGLELCGLLILALILHGLKDSYDAKHEAIGAARVQVLWDADKAKRVKAFSDAMTKYVNAQGDADAYAKQLAAEHQGRIDDAKKRARNLPPADAGARFPGSARGVLNDAVGDPAATAGTTGQPAGSSAATAEDSSVGIVTQWAVDVIGFYSACRDEVIGWQRFYAALQAAQPEVTP